MEVTSSCPSNLSKTACAKWVVINANTNVIIFFFLYLLLFKIKFLNPHIAQDI
jgi:hypothetical protein